MRSDETIHSLLEDVDCSLAAQLKKGGAPVASLVVRRNGTDLVHKVYRNALDRTVSGCAEPLFRIGSQSKTLTVAALITLIDRGIVPRTAPICDLLPELGFKANTPIGRATILQLARHQSILGRIDALLLRGRGGQYRLPRRPWRAEELLDAVTKGRWNVSPRARPFCEYSDVGIALLGLIIERASGMSYDRYVRTRVLRPNGLVSLRPIYREAEWPPRHELLTGHYNPARPSQGTPFDLGALNPSFSAVASAGGSARFYDSLLAGRLLSPWMTASLTAAAIPLWPEREDYRYGLGVIELPIEGVPTPQNCYGHLCIFAGFCGFTAYHPLSRTTISLFLNTMMSHEDADGCSRRANPAGFVRAIFAKIAGRAAAQQGWAAPRPRLSLWRS